MTTDIRRGSFRDHPSEFPEAATHGWTCRVGHWNPPSQPYCHLCDPHHGYETAVKGRDRIIGIALLALVQAAETGAIDLAGEIRDLAHHLGAT